MKLTDSQIKTIVQNAIRSGNDDLMQLASDALYGGTHYVLLCGQHQPCGECGEPILDPEMVAAQDRAIAAYPDHAPKFTRSPIAHHDCDHPEVGSGRRAEEIHG